jgi:hypothetical protein
VSEEGFYLHPLNGSTKHVRPFRCLPGLCRGGDGCALNQTAGSPYPASLNVSILTCCEGNRVHNSPLCGTCLEVRCLSSFHHSTDPAIPSFNSFSMVL